MRRRLLHAALVALLMGATWVAADGPLTPLMNIRGRTDASGYLRVTGGGYSGADGPLTPLANLRGTTDANGYLLVSMAGAIPAAASGTCVTPSYTFTGDTDTGIGYLAANNAALCAGGATIADWASTGLNLASGLAYKFNAGAGLFDGGANIIEQRNGTNAQKFKTYNTFTDASNYERGELGWSSNEFQIGIAAAGTGVTTRGLTFYSSGGAVKISADSGSNYWQFAAGASPHFTPKNNNSFDIGGAGAGPSPRTVYAATSVVSPLVNATTGLQINGAAASGQLLVGNGTNFVSLQPAWATANPANQTGNATATLKMNGLGAAAAPCTITPVATGRVRFAIYGTIANTLTADGVTYKIAYGTGGAPANAAAATGTILGVQQTWTALTGELNTLFNIEGIATGLALSTATWFDLQIADVTGGTASATNIVCVATEG